jgi:hypothetical protein
MHTVPLTYLHSHPYLTLSSRIFVKGTIYFIVKEKETEFVVKSHRGPPMAVGPLTPNPWRNDPSALPPTNLI